MRHAAQATKKSAKAGSEAALTRAPRVFEMLREAHVKMESRVRREAHGEGSWQWNVGRDDWDEVLADDGADGAHSHPKLVQERETNEAERDSKRDGVRKDRGARAKMRRTSFSHWR